MKKLLSVVLVCLMALDFTGCPKFSVDQVMAGLETADKVALAAKTILVTNPEIANVAGQVSTDLEVIVKTYKDYEAAGASDKATKAELIRATSQAITQNLAAILDAVRVKNPKILMEVTTFVAIVNSAVIVLLAKVPAPTQARAAVISEGLPVLQNAKSARDLRREWNAVVAKSFPKAKI